MIGNGKHLKRITLCLMSIRSVYLLLRPPPHRSWTLRCEMCRNNTVDTLETTRDMPHISLRVYDARLSTHIGILTNPVTCNVFLYQSHLYIQHRTANRCQPFSIHLPEDASYQTSIGLNPEQHVPDTHCGHLNLKLPMHFRRCHRSVQKEDQERSPLPSTTRQTPGL